MARYLKGSVNNAWDKREHISPVKATVLGPPVPDSDEKLIRALVNARSAYQLWRRPEMLDLLKSIGQQLVDRGITSLTEEQLAAARAPKPTLTQAMAQLRQDLGGQS